MDLFATILTSSWASGINLYLTLLLLGLAQRMQWVDLPGELSVLGHPIILTLTFIMVVIEFIADKIPAVDSMWDTLHTFIRPIGGAMIGYLAMSEMDPIWQWAVMLLAGGVSFETHLTKATSRAAINTSPEPVSNIAASVGEDVAVVGLIYLMFSHPVLSAMIVVLLIVLSFWLLKKFYILMKNIFNKQQIKRDIS